ncbi:hypothetical protein [Mesorhizobium sp. M0159]|uniref:hypothetical protein n=1 Tax=Mesorhizobium sp. M0159 TaxID=2956900 RepID=UPI003337EB34
MKNREALSCSEHSSTSFGVAAFSIGSASSFLSLRFSSSTLSNLEHSTLQCPMAAASIVELCLADPLAPAEMLI